ATMGLGAAFVMPSTLSILTNVFPAHERARAISMWAGIAAGGAALGPPTSGFLLEHFWWGSVFLLTVPITAVALIAGHRLVPTSRDPDETRLDVPGALLSVVGIGALVYAIIEGPEAGWASAATLGTLAFAVVAIAAFFTWESHSSHPMLDLTLFRDRRFSVASAGIGLAFFTMFGIFFLITQLFQLVHGLSPLAAGLMILPMSFTLMLVSPRAASLVDRFGVDRVVPTGLATIGGALALLAGLSQLDSVWWVELALVPLATGMAITMSPLTTLIMSAVPRSRAGMGSAMNDATRELGGALGVAILGSLASTVYVSRLPTLDGFAPDAASEVRDGLAGAIANAPELSNGRPTVFLDSARDAFLGGMFVALVAAAALAFAAALAARRWLPRSAATDTTEQPTARIIGAVGGS
ncbi:MAG: MFS transporter, partial [Ilumatobacter sp.]